MTTGPAPQFHGRVPPLNGAFPLDHDGECKPQVLAYLQCLREAAVQVSPRSLESAICAPLAKAYFECRLRSGLISETDWQILGLGVSPVSET